MIYLHLSNIHNMHNIHNIHNIYSQLKKTPKEIKPQEFTPSVLPTVQLRKVPEKAINEEEVKPNIAPSVKLKSRNIAAAADTPVATWGCGAGSSCGALL